jgi:hypothetical protein
MSVRPLNDDDREASQASRFCIGPGHSFIAQSSYRDDPRYL